MSHNGNGQMMNQQSGSGGLGAMAKCFSWGDFLIGLAVGALFL